MRVALAQINTLVGDVPGNTERVLRSAARARDEFGADLVVFPELTLTGYPPEDLLLHAGLRVRVAEGLHKLIHSVAGITAIVGYPHYETAETVYNAAAVIGDGAIQDRYFKQLLPNYGVFDEKRYFASGMASCVVPIAGVKTAITICEDVWQPGPVASARDAGARLILNLNASPFEIGKQRRRERVVAERVGESGIPILYVNLVGGQDELVFDGGSFVTSADRSVGARAAPYAEELLIVDVAADGAPAPGVVTPRLDDMPSIYGALRLGVHDYVEKHGFPGIVLGLSGGIDSALTLAIAVDALGAERVQAVMMPSRYTAGMSLEDAREQASGLGVRYDVIPIEGMFEATLDALADLFAGLPHDTTEENIQARCRGIILMALSNKTGKMVLTTGNKSEMAVGYATLYGDMAGGFAPIKDCSKTQVFALARYRNSLGQVIPERVITRPPSAELRPDQKDSDSLPPYEELDPILEAFIEEDCSVDQIVERGFDRDTVGRVLSMVKRNEYKRRQAPPGVRVSRRAFGRDWRYPITSGY